MIKELSIFKIAESRKFVLNKDNGVNSLANKSNETMQLFNMCKNIYDANKSPLNQKNNNLQYFDAKCKVTYKLPEPYCRFQNELIDHCFRTRKKLEFVLFVLNSYKRVCKSIFKNKYTN